jgi:hypothetical protein
MEIEAVEMLGDWVSGRHFYSCINHERDITNCIQQQRCCRKTYSFCLFVPDAVVTGY